MAARATKGQFGVVIEFSLKDRIDYPTYKTLTRAGFERSDCMTLNHWRSRSSDWHEQRAQEIADEYNIKRFGGTWDKQGNFKPSKAVA